MPNITTCTVCGKEYEEIPNDKEQMCKKCHHDKGTEHFIAGLSSMLNAVSLEVTELQNKNADIEARLKVLEDRLGVNIHNPCSTG